MGESLVFSFISFPQAKHRKALPEINDIEFHLLVRGSCMECSRCGGDLYLGSRHCHGGTYRYERIKNAGSGGDYHG